MTMQLLGPGTLKYAPTRDIVHLLPSVLQTAVEAAIDKKPWPDLDLWLKEHSITDDDLADGFFAYSTFMANAPSSYEKKMTEALEESGWLGLKWEVRVAVMFYISYILTGTFYRGAQIAVDDEHDIPSLIGLIEAGKQLDDYVRIPKWRKWVSGWWFKRNRKSPGIPRI